MKTSIKEAGCGLKNRLRFFFRFCIRNIHGIPSISMWKKPIPHRDCSETGAI